MGFIDSFDVPEEVAGYLEWVSGILFVNCTLEEWREIITTSQQSWFHRKTTIFSQTITHETYHFYQIATTGYLYRFVSKLFAEVAERMGFPVTKESLDKVVADISSNTSVALADLAAELDRPGPRDLTVRDIVESAAYLYEYKHHYPAFDAQSFREQIEIEDPGKEYQYAFELAQEHLGDNTFDNFLAVSVLSLCFDNPTEAFFTALETIRKTGIVYKHTEHLKPIIAASEQISALHYGLGTAAQVAFENQNLIPRQNPIFREAAYLLNSNASTLNPLALLVDPKVMNEFGMEVVRPVQLKGGAIWIPEEFRKRADSNKLENIIKALVILGAISLKLHNSVQLSRFRRPLA